MKLKYTIILLACMAMVYGCKKDGKTKNGYAYKTIKSGSGKGSAFGDVVTHSISIYADSVLINEAKNPNQYPKTLITNEKMDHKISAAINDMLFGCKVGDSLELVIPVDSVPPAPEFMGKKNIFFRVGIREIKDTISVKKEMEAKREKFTAAMKTVQTQVESDIDAFKAAKATTLKTKSGLEYIMHTKGNGPILKPGQSITVDYYGCLENKTPFDASYKVGEPITFPVGQGSVIPGWDEILTTVPKGSKITVFIPSKLGYGESGNGPIPPNSNLVFYIDIKE